MYRYEDTLIKLNNKLTGSQKKSKPIAVTDIMHMSFSELRGKASDFLTREEIRQLHKAAREEYKKNKITDARILSRANPQLARAVRLGISQSTQLQGYNDLLDNRADKYVRPDSVAALTSPAAYLTELYSEARRLHPATSTYRLDKRRPDLGSLVLSQQNMDEEVSTLALSNEYLLEHITPELANAKSDTGETQAAARAGRDSYDQVMEMLSTYRLTGDTPFHYPYEAARKSILLQDPEFSAFGKNPDVAKLMSPTSLLGIYADISPDLYNILTEVITEASMDELINRNFGDMDLRPFQDISYLARYYSLSYEELTSFVGFLTSQYHDAPGHIIEHYQNDTLLQLLKVDDGSLNALLITREPDVNNGAYRFVELIPQGNGNYLFNFSPKNSYPDKTIFKIALGDTTLYQNDNFSPVGGVNYSLPIKFGDDIFTGTKTFQIRRAEPGTSESAAFYTFTIQSYPFNIFLLKLNKLIRLFKATNISPVELLSIIGSINSELTINDAVLARLFYVKYYGQHYTIDTTKALVLSNSNIPQVAVTGSTDAFTLLFNSPPLNGAVFTADGTEIDLTSGKATDAFIIPVLKRAFNVDEAGLLALWAIASGNQDLSAVPKFKNTLLNLSVLYRVRLFADVHELTVTELRMMVSLSPYKNLPLSGITDTNLIGLINFLDSYTSWMASLDLSVSEVYSMVTSHYSLVLTPDIENMLELLRNGLAGRTEQEDLIGTIAPYIAAGSGIDSSEKARAVLTWLEVLKPGGLNVAEFVKLALASELNEQQTTNLVKFCQVLGQLVLITQRLGLTESELLFVTQHPERIIPGTTVLPLQLSTLLTLSAFHQWVQQCGELATEILSSLSEGLLTAAQLARALALDEQLIEQAQKEVNSRADTFSSWPEVSAALQWVDMSETFGITPAGIRALLNLDYLNRASPPTFSDWNRVSSMLQGGLSAPQTAQLQGWLDEVLSAALAAWYIRNLAPGFVTGRDELYSWLLLDNQVSSQVRTTRLADAISSIQLYVNRALNGAEENIDNSVAGRQFFLDWDRYNKRYSTWAGLAQLVYYPENYVDPTLRLNQTQMMDDLLQLLSQSQLNSDTVEDGVRQYLTAFDEIANLKVISGHHAHTESQRGLTYFIGASQTEPKRYYWRSVNHDLFSDGSFPANAWTEWKEIVSGISAYHEYVKPVIHNSRLYVLWIEQKEMRAEDGETPLHHYDLRVSHIRYNGSWSSPISIDVTSVFGTQTDNNIDANKLPGFYCSSYDVNDSVVALFYPHNSGSSTSEKQAWTIFQDMTYEKVEENVYEYIYGLIDNELDTQNNASSSQQSIISKTITSQFTYDFKIKEQSPDDRISIEFELDEIVIYEPVLGHVNLDVKPTITLSNTGDTSHLTDTETLLSNQLDDITGSFLYYENSWFFISSGIQILRNSANLIVIKNDTVISYSLIPWRGNTINDITNYTIEYMKYGVDDSKIFDADSSNLTLVDGGEYALLQGNFAREAFPGHDNFDSLIEYLNYVNVSFRLDYNDSDGNRDVAWYTGENSHIKTIKNYVDPEDLILDFNINSETISSTSAAKGCPVLPNRTADVLVYPFDNIKVDLTGKADAEKTEIEVRVTMPGASRAGTLTLTRAQTKKVDNITIHSTSTDAQYIEQYIYRTRLNTLFARELIGRASTSIDAVLTMDTQTLPEPQPGEGSYITLTFERYQASTFGSSPAYELIVKAIFSSNDRYTLASGTVDSNIMVTQTVFIPHINEAANNNSITLFARYQTGDTVPVKLKGAKDSSGTFKWELDETVNGGTFAGLKSLSVLNVTTEPMDFKGANALYFWELFFYTPMMVFQRLLQEQNFTEATRWLHYLWDPAGYIVNGLPQPYYWNVRPLEEDTGWNDNPLDTVDPDAVAQNDPMHYKVAVFMRRLDLLIARGDAAFRVLERDSLNEAKSWYIQALSLLGEEPYVDLATNWPAPRLDEAADEASRQALHEALLLLRDADAVPAGRTASALATVFYPVFNSKLQGYWQLLAQRLYNLRHNLSIDGQPLSLPVYATPADPAALLTAAVNAAQGSSALPAAAMPLYRFPVILDSARGLVSQLTQFGSSLLSITERQDAEALSEMLQTQGTEVLRLNIALQEKEIAALDADRATLEASRQAAQSRHESYSALYNENVSRGEKDAMDLYMSSSIINTTATALHMTAASLEMVPNIYGVAVGGSRFGALFNATAIGTEIASSATRTAADKTAQSEIYRRRRQEWEIQRNAAEADMRAIDAQLAALAVRREAAVQQRDLVEAQQAQMTEQLTFLQNKFSSKALYNWLRGKLAAIYYQFYDLCVSRCLMAEQACRFEMNNASLSVVKPGVWQGTYGGLLAGETLMLYLAQMEQAWLDKDRRALEVNRTVSLAAVYGGLEGDSAFTFSDVAGLVESGRTDTPLGAGENTVTLTGEGLLQAGFSLADLAIAGDYPAGLGSVRRVKQISVTLPALVGPYEDIRAVLSYGGNELPPGQGREYIAISHGMNDSGQFQLDFRDSRYLPFEGLPVDGRGSFTLQFPDAGKGQKAMLLSLTDIIVHIRYTISQ